MSKLPVCILIFAGLFRLVAAHGQIVPDGVIGTFEGEYVLVPPNSIVNAGVPPGAETGQCLKDDEGSLVWGTCGGGATTPLSDDTPMPPGIAAPGMSPAASRSDHVHLAQTVPPLSDATPLVAGTASAGSGGTSSRGDHVHPAQPTTPLSDTAPKQVGTAAAGTGTSASRDDHVHGLNPAQNLPTAISHSDNTAVVVQSGKWTPIDPTTLIRAGLPPISDTGFGGSVLTLTPDNPSNVNQIKLAWKKPASGGSLSNATPKPTGVAPVIGVSNASSRGDHVHNVTFGTSAPKAPASTASVGSGGLPGHWDHVHPFQPLSSFGSVGVNGLCAKSDGSGGLKYADCGSPRVLSNANPKVAGTVAPGTSLQVSRGDHVHPLQPGIALSNTTPSNTNAAADAGTSAAASRGDHIHGVTLSALTPKAAGTASPGSSDLPGPWDHVHPREVPGASATAKGDIPRIKSDGSSYELVDPHVAVLSGLPAITGQGGKVLTVNSGATGVEWGSGGGGGGGGGGGLVWTKLVDITIPTCSSQQAQSTCPKGTVTLTDDQAKTCRDAELLGFIHDTTVWSVNHVFLPLDLITGTATSARITSGLTPLTFPFNATIRCGTTDGAKKVEAVFPDFASPNTRTITMYTAKSSGGGGGGGTSPVPAPSGAGNYVRVASNGTAYELGALPFSDIVPQGTIGATGRAGTLKGIARPDHRHPRDSEVTASALLIQANSQAVDAVKKTVPPAIATGNRGQYLRVKSGAAANSGTAGMEWAAAPAAIQPATATPKPSMPAIAAAVGTSSKYAREDHVHQGPVSKVMATGNCTVSDNRCRVSFNSSTPHIEMTRADPYVMFQVTLRQTIGSTNVAYGVWCHGSATPMGNAESREFYCWGPRGDGQSMHGEIGITPTSWAVEVENLNTRGATSLVYHVVGIR